MTSLKVFTLNVWGIPVGCKLRKERISAIGDELGKGEYDIVVLQEVWQKSDYRTLADKVCPTMPFTHYFYSGMVGSGLCVFSKGPIRDIQFFRFHLNGYAHKLQHGDWFGGKGVGMCKIEYKGLNITIYTAHLHAEYNRLNDEYHSHRIAQSFELSQVVKLTTADDCDLVILGGDLNLEPVDPGLQIILANAGLTDAWLQKPVSPSDSVAAGNTCNVPSNSYAKSSDLKMYPDGKRIDYILYKSSPRKSVMVDDCYIPNSKIHNEQNNFSDHEPLAAVFSVSDAAEPNMSVVRDKQHLSTLLTHAISVMDDGLANTSKSRTMYLAIFVVCAAILCFTSTLTVPSGAAGLAMAAARLVLVVGALYALWSHIVLNRAEENGHREVRECMHALNVPQLNGDKKQS